MFIKVIALIGLLLLTPSVWCIYETAKSLFSLLGALWANDEVFVELLIQNLVSTVIFQAFCQALLIPGVVLCSIVTYKFKIDTGWYWRGLKIFAIIMFATPPLMTVLGLYVNSLGKKYHY